MITKDYVEMAYRLILGREPENTDVVENYCQTMHSIEELRLEFLKSPEFVLQMTRALEMPKFLRQRHPFNLPHIPIEVDATQEQLSLMFKRMSDTWEGLGNVEPYWSVLTQPQYKMENYSKNSEKFYRSGGPLFRTFIASLKRNGINPAELSICLEVGCGSGRMTGYLAETFKKVIGAEISSQHLKVANDRLIELGVQNVELVHWKNLMQVQELPSVDVILSVITLQHNPPPIIAWFLFQLLKSLGPGGVAFIQLPTYRNGYFFEIEPYLSGENCKEMEMHFLPQQEVFKIIENTNCRCIEIREDGMVGDEEKMLSNTFLIQKRPLKAIPIHS